MIKKILFPIYLIGCICLMTFFTLNTSSAQVTTEDEPCTGGSATVTCKDAEHYGSGAFRARICTPCAFKNYNSASGTGTCTFCT